MAEGKRHRLLPCSGVRGARQRAGDGGHRLERLPDVVSRSAVVRDDAMTRRLVFTLLLSASACAPSDQCQAGATRCFVYGNFVEAQRCENDCGDFGCAYQWQGADVCSPTRDCLMVSRTGAMCVLSTAADPRCTGATGFCDGDARFGCRAGYAVERTVCATVLPRCISVGDGDAACVPSAAAPDANCPAGRSRYCSAAEGPVECVGGESVLP